MLGVFIVIVDFRSCQTTGYRAFTRFLYGSQNPAPDETTYRSNQIPVRRKFKKTGSIWAIYPRFRTEQGVMLAQWDSRKTERQLGNAKFIELKVAFTICYPDQAKIGSPKAPDQAIDDAFIRLAFQQDEFVQPEWFRTGVSFTAEHIAQTHGPFAQRGHGAGKRIGI